MRGSKIKRIEEISWSEFDWSKKESYTFSAATVVQSELEEVFAMLKKLALQMEREICESNHTINQLYIFWWGVKTLGALIHCNPA